MESKFPTTRVDRMDYRLHCRDLMSTKPTAKYKKLTIKREALRKLSPEKLKDAAGACPSTWGTAYCFSWGCASKCKTACNTCHGCY